MPAGPLERVHLAVEHGAALLHAPVMSPPQHVPAVHKHGTNRNAAFGQSAFRFFDGFRQKAIHASAPGCRPAAPHH